MASGQWLILTKDCPEEPGVIAPTPKSSGKEPEATAVDTTDNYAEKYEVWEENIRKNPNRSFLVKDRSPSHNDQNGSY